MSTHYTLNQKGFVSIVTLISSGLLSLCAITYLAVHATALNVQETTKMNAIKDEAKIRIVHEFLSPDRCGYNLDYYVRGLNRGSRRTLWSELLGVKVVDVDLERDKDAVTRSDIATVTLYNLKFMIDYGGSRTVANSVSLHVAFDSAGNMLSCTTSLAHLKYQKGEDFLGGDSEMDNGTGDYVDPGEAPGGGPAEQPTGEDDAAYL